MYLIGVPNITSDAYDPNSKAFLFHGDRLDMLAKLPKESARLVVTSPPYNIGKSYESKTSFQNYILAQEQTIQACMRVLAPDGSICWQTGNCIIGQSEILPLHIPIHGICDRFGLKCRNLVIWPFSHGLHCKKRLSGRYETILWFTKSEDYVFNLDPIRVPQKYPQKRYFRGPKKGQLSCNPLGKNPGDWWDGIPNVKHNHVEKTKHPCQFPVELVERLVLSLTNENDLVVDPYCGVASSGVSSIMHGRRFAGSDTVLDYLEQGQERIEKALRGELKTRKMGTPIFDPVATVEHVAVQNNVGMENLFE